MIRASGGGASAVVEVWCLVATLQYLQHAPDGALVGTDKLAVALVGSSAGLKNAIELFCLGKDFHAYRGTRGERRQAVPVGAKLCLGKRLAAEGAVLTQQREQRLLLSEQLFQACEVALGERLVFGVGELKKLTGGADIVKELLKHFGILHSGL